LTNIYNSIYSNCSLVNFIYLFIITMLTLTWKLTEVITSNPLYPKIKITTDYWYNLVNIVPNSIKDLEDKINSDISIKVSVFPKKYKERLFIEYKMLWIL